MVGGGGGEDDINDNVQLRTFTSEQRSSKVRQTLSPKPLAEQLTSLPREAGRKLQRAGGTTPQTMFTVLEPCPPCSNAQEELDHSSDLAWPSSSKNVRQPRSATSIGINAFAGPALHSK